MDSDEFDDDIADEDLIFAATQAPSNIRSSNSIPNSKPHTPRPSGVQGANGLAKHPAVSLKRSQPVSQSTTLTFAGWWVHAKS